MEAVPSPRTTAYLSMPNRLNVRIRGLNLTVAGNGGKTCTRLRFIRTMIGASSGGGLFFALFPRLGEHHRETHYCSLWNAEYDCPCSKFALVFAVFSNGRLPTLHLRHLSTVSCRSPSQERILHSKLHIPAIIAGHSAALARLFSPILLGLAPHRRRIRVSPSPG